MALLALAFVAPAFAVSLAKGESATKHGGTPKPLAPSTSSEDLGTQTCGATPQDTLPQPPGFAPGPRWPDLPLFMDAEGFAVRPAGLHVMTGDLADTSIDAPLSSGPYHAAVSSPADRWGIPPAWLLDGDGTLVQQRLLEAGLALADLTDDTLPPPCLAALALWEQTGRRHRRGVWKTRFPLRSDRPATILPFTGQEVVIEGPLVSLGKTAKTRYLNFGGYWKVDLTATITAARIAPFRETLEALDRSLGQGKTVRVRLRGLVEDRDGPLVELVHPRQLDILDVTKDAE